MTSGVYNDLEKVEVPASAPSAPITCAFMGIND